MGGKAAVILATLVSFCLAPSSGHNSLVIGKEKGLSLLGIVVDTLENSSPFRSKTVFLHLWGLSQSLLLNITLLSLSRRGGFKGEGRIMEAFLVSPKSLSPKRAL